MISDQHLVATIAALSGVVGWFGIRMWADLKATRARVDRLTESYSDLRENYGSLRTVVKGVQSCPLAGCQWRSAFAATPPMGERLPRKKGDSDPANPSVFSEL